MVTRPYFLWDYDLTEEDVQSLLRTGDEETRIWLASRISMIYMLWQKKRT